MNIHLVLIISSKRAFNKSEKVITEERTREARN